MNLLNMGFHLNLISGIVIDDRYVIDDTFDLKILIIFAFLSRIHNNLEYKNYLLNILSIKLFIYHFSCSHENSQNLR